MTAISALYVEGERDMRDIVSMALGLDADFDVSTAGTGMEALKLIGAPESSFDVIILDRKMQDMDGFQLVDAIRTMPGLQATPIVFLTVHVRAHDLDRHRTAGVAGTIAKPFDPLTLATQVRHLAGNRGARTT